MILAGVSNDYNFSPDFSHFILIQGSYVDFENCLSPIMKTVLKRILH
jgi:hypothetical protein